jgi:hypothetical protein
MRHKTKKAIENSMALRKVKKSYRVITNLV